MKLFRFETEQTIPAPLEEVWEFFSSPVNLKVITPPYMGFDILTPVPDRMEPGIIIAYTVRPLWGIPMFWVTEITHVEPLRFFVDEQRFGPYRFWHHRHTFTPVAGRCAHDRPGILRFASSIDRRRYQPSCGAPAH
jgi:ligand-binding SRPBCC domain-containing protein